MPFLAAIPAIASAAGAAGTIGAVGSGISGLASGIAGANAKADADKTRDSAIAQLEAVGVPSVEAQKIVLQNPEFVAQWQTQQEQAQQAGPSAMGDVSTDPRLAMAQMQALDTMQQLGQNSFTPEEMAQLKSMQRSQAQRGKANQESILQNMAQRGQAGSGSELAARLASAQAGAQQEAESSERLNAEAHSRALQAMMNAGELGGKIRGQEFGEKSAQAQAADQIEAFNVQQRAGVGQRNVAAQNQAAQQQAMIRQDQENERARLLNAQEAHNKSLQQAKFENEMQKAGGVQKAMYGKAGQQYDEAANVGQSVKDIGMGITKGAQDLQNAADALPKDPLSMAEQKKKYGQPLSK